MAVRSPADARRLDRRLAAAALEACGASIGSLAEIRLATLRSPCYATALAHARADVARSTASAAVGDMTGER